MAFIAKNPLIIPEVESPSSVPDPGTRGLFAREDGWYEIDSEGQAQKIGADLTQEQLDNIAAVPSKADKADLEIISEQVGSIEKSMPKNLSDFINDTKYVTEDDLDNALDYGLLKIEGHETNPKISVISEENQTSTSLTIDFYQLNLSGSYIFGNNINLSGFVCATPIDDFNLANKFYVDSKKLSQFTNDAGFITLASVPKQLSQLTNDKGFVNQGYVDGLVGDIDAALDAILAIQNNYINGVMAANEGGDE